MGCDALKFSPMHPKTYSVGEHRLRLSSIDPDALYVMEKLRHAGHISYLVGGSVRDLLLDQQPKDYDISTSAKPEEVKQLFRNCILIGRRFRLAHIRFGKKIIEVATFRAGDTETDALIVRDNDWGTPEQDVLRRDFTINGLFYDPATETIIDFVDGYPDLKKNILRTIGQPFLRFKQDPVRMIRLLKFQARFGFDIEPQALIALLECRGEILKSSQARILEELLRMLETGASCPFFKLMSDHGMLNLLLPELSTFLETEHASSVFNFLKEADALFHKKETSHLDRSVLLSCLLFPIFYRNLNTHFIAHQQIPHLGDVMHEAHQLIDSVFRPFFLLPRRLRLSLASILTSQFRLTPFETKKRKKPRIPNDPDFGLALKFLSIRRRLDSSLEKIWEEWHALYGDFDQNLVPRRRRKRKRRHAH